MGKCNDYLLQTRNHFFHSHITKHLYLNENQDH